MTHTLTAQIEDLFENGIIHILHVLPSAFSEEERLSVESIVYTAYGMYRTYRRLEDILMRETTVEDGLIKDARLRRDIFADAWAIVDAAYALKQIATLPHQKAFLSLSEYTREGLQHAAALRNYMGHLRDNFRNSVKARGWFPLFGSLTYQFTPHARDTAVPPDHILIVSVASTHVRGPHQFDMAKHSSSEVIGVVDHATLHIKASQSCDLSRLMASLALDLNAYSVAVQSRVVEALKDTSPDIQGIMTPYATVVARADFSMPTKVTLIDLKTPLELNKIRMTIKSDQG
jgi:hypothetical protein